MTTKLASPLRQLAGLRAKKQGSAFETIFERSCKRSGLVCLRMPDGCRQVGPKLIRVATPFDWIVTRNSRGILKTPIIEEVTGGIYYAQGPNHQPNLANVAFLDTKSYGKETRLMPSMIKEHQMRALLAQEQAGCIAGYVIHLRTLESVVFAPASLLDRIYTSGKGVGMADLQDLGSTMEFNVQKIFERAA